MGRDAKGMTGEKQEKRYLSIAVEEGKAATQVYPWLAPNDD